MAPQGKRGRQEEDMDRSTKDRGEVQCICGFSTE